MFTVKFWDKLGEELASRWAAQVFGPALFFWLGGLLAWVHRSGWDWKKVVDWVAAFDSVAAYVALAAGGLALLFASAAVARRVELPLIRLAEGYGWPRALHHWIARGTARRLVEIEERWDTLDQIPEALRSADQQAAYARLTARRLRYPTDPDDLLPTPLGNLMRAAEEHSYVRYGLASSVCWPRLWLILPEGTQAALSQAHQDLLGAARLLFWGLLFAVWAIWAWWAVPLAITAAAAACRGMYAAAGVYGDLLRAAFDLHRFQLYEALRWPLPAAPAQEVVDGKALSEHLSRGTASGPVRFVVPDKK